MNEHSTDVVIVGGGLVGVATAYFLSLLGIESIVVERDGLGSHASGFSYAALGTFDEAGMTDNHFEVGSLGMRLHKELAESLYEETGVDVEFRERPMLGIVFDEKEAEAVQNPKGHDAIRRSWEVDDQGYTIKWVDEKAARGIESRISSKALGGIYTEGTTDVNAYRLTLALAMAAEQRGAQVMNGTVTGLVKDDGRVRGVMVNGTQIACDRVVVAMGPWSQASSNWLGIPILMQPWKGQILRLRLPGPPIRSSVVGGDYFTSTKPDGHTWVGATFEDVGLDESTTSEARESIMAGAVKNIPSLSEGQIVLQTACLRPLSSDRKLILGKVPDLDGAYVATGGGRLGLMMGPAMGSLIADLIDDDVTGISLDAFNPGRFV